MAKFCELGIESDVVIGKGIEIEELFNRRILIEKTIIQPTKYPGKNASDSIPSSQNFAIGVRFNV